MHWLEQLAGARRVKVTRLNMAAPMCSCEKLHNIPIILFEQSTAMNFTFCISVMPSIFPHSEVPASRLDFDKKIEANDKKASLI